MGILSAQRNYALLNEVDNWMDDNLEVPHVVLKGNQTGMVIINHTTHANGHCLRAEFQSILA